MQPSTPLVQSPRRRMLRKVEHPDLSWFLTHFCDRGRPPRKQVPADIYRLSAQERLTSILWDQALRAFVTYSGGHPAVGFTESTLQGLNFLISQRRYQPWGLVFDRQSVYDAGGGPVWHARREQYEKLEQLNDPDLRSWAVRLDPESKPESDWLEEREWRIPRPAITGQPPVVQLSELRLVALLVGDPSWTGARYTRAIATATSQPAQGLFFPWLPSGLPRWCWNSTAGQIQALPPLF